MTASTNHTVSDVMTPTLLTLPADASIYGAAEVMRDHDVGDVLVMEGDPVVGVVTDRDLVVMALALGRAPESTTVAEVCSTDVAGVPLDAEIDVAVDLMRKRAIRRLPVVDAHGRVLGIVSIGDLAVTRDPHSALADISSALPNV